MTFTVGQQGDLRNSCKEGRPDLDRIQMSDWVTASCYTESESFSFKSPWAVNIQLPVLDLFPR